MTTTSEVGPLPPLDPELAAGLAGMPAIGLGDSVTVDMIPARRELVAQLVQVADEELQRGGSYDVSTRLVPGPEGAPDVELLICLPTAATTPVAALYHVHGGGMILGSNRTGVTGMLDLAAPHGMAVVSVEYRLAPEHPYPAGVEDCY